MRRGTVVAAIAALCIAGCGSGDQQPEPRPGLTAAQRAGLMTRLERVRAAATAGDKPLAQTRVRGFIREVRRLEQARALNAATAAALVKGAAQALARIEIDVVPPAPAPEPAKKHPKKDEFAPHGKGKKHDRKHGEEGD